MYFCVPLFDFSLCCGGGTLPHTALAEGEGGGEKPVRSWAHVCDHLIMRDEGFLALGFCIACLE